MTPDFRINFPSPRIDFTSDVGLTNTDVDNYPPPQGQSRYDHMRSMLLGLLTNQASFDEPTIMADGTLWFDLNDQTLKIRRSNQWTNISDAIPLGNPDDGGIHLTLEEWFTTTNAALSSLAQEITFNGVSTSDNITDINIPASLQQFIFTDTRCFFHVNGLLIDPRNCSLIGTPATTIRLSNISLSTGDEFNVSLRRVPSSSFYTSTVSVP